MSKTLREHCEKAVSDGVDGLYVRPESVLSALDDAVKAEHERIAIALKHWADVYGGLALKQLREIVAGGPLVDSCVEGCRKAERDTVLALIKGSLVSEVRLACDLGDAKVVLVSDVQEALDWARSRPLSNQATETSPEEV